MIFKQILRECMRRPLYSGMAVMGMTVSLTACMLILLYTAREFRYDRWDNRSGRIVRVGVTYSSTEGTRDFAVTPAQLGPEAVQAMPEVLRCARFWKTDPSTQVQVQAVRFSGAVDNFMYADPGIFEVFPFTLANGDEMTALAGPDRVILSEDSAAQLFGGANPVGETITVTTDHSRTFLVSGVLENPPGPTHLRPGMIASFATLERDMPFRVANWNYLGFYTYLLLQDPGDADRVAQSLERIGQDHYEEDENRRTSFFLQDVERIHLYSRLEDELTENGDIRQVLALIAVLGGILAVAGINYTNLAIARMPERVRETGIRKLFGATSGQVAVRFVAESAVYAVISVVFAFSMVEILLPLVNHVLAEPLSFSYIHDMLLCLILTAGALVLSLLAGLYPAVVLARSEPSDILGAQPGRYLFSWRLRRILVTVQFAVSAVLIVLTMVIFKQATALTGAVRGVSIENIITVPVPGTFPEQAFHMLKEKLLKDQHIIGVTGLSEVPLDGSMPLRREFRALDSHADSMVSVCVMAADRDFLDTFGINLAAGSALTDTSDVDEFLVNEAAVEAFGWDDPVGQRLSHWVGQTGTVAGVVRDFNFMSLDKKIEPLAISISPHRYRYVAIRTDGSADDTLLDRIEAIWREEFHGTPYSPVRLEQAAEEATRDEFRFSGLLAGFSFAAMAISCFGLFALTSMVVSQRLRELSIRKVYGAENRDIAMLLSSDLAGILAGALLIAFPVAWVTGSWWLRRFYYHIDMGINVLIPGAVITFALVVLTVSIHILRAARIEPATILRYE